MTTVGVWQDPFRKYRILEQVLHNLDPSTESEGPHDLNNQYLRVVGNAIAYNGNDFLILFPGSI